MKDAMTDEATLPFLSETDLDFPTGIYPKPGYDKPLDPIDQLVIK